MDKDNLKLYREVAELWNSGEYTLKDLAKKYNRKNHASIRHMLAMLRKHEPNLYIRNAQAVRQVKYVEIGELWHKGVRNKSELARRFGYKNRHSIYKALEWLRLHRPHLVD